MNVAGLASLPCELFDETRAQHDERVIENLTNVFCIVQDLRDCGLK